MINLGHIFEELRSFNQEVFSDLGEVVSSRRGCSSIRTHGTRTLDEFNLAIIHKVSISFFKYKIFNKKKYNQISNSF